CPGEITMERRGENGFGYDPVFRPDGFSQTFAQISLNEKSLISHRGKATSQLIDFLNKGII
ncbi:MAG TPA: non-canonical purine NTP pyrophosphatase, partial [Salinimicrobium sp.]|nr:non-canonical purine NTP pyrophosphatase [Salinimicrobium sp.]